MLQSDVVDPPRLLDKIEEETFKGCTGLTSMTIPNSVTEIGEGAFKECTGLTSVTIPNSVTGIGKSAFYGCTSLTSVTIPNSVTGIGESAFYGCSSLTSVTIPESVTEIGEWAFYGCSSLESVTFPESVREIGMSAFKECTGLTSVTFPESVRTIGMSAFNGCTGLTSVTFPESVRKIEESTFEGCTSLTSVKIRYTMYTIEKFAFRGCSSLESFDLSQVKEIGDGTFAGCSNLKEFICRYTDRFSSEDGVLYDLRKAEIVQCAESRTEFVIPGTVTSIRGYAFAYCETLASITIPESVTEFGECAFYGCSNLKDITDLNPKPQSVGKDAFAGVPSDANIYIPKGSYVAYMTNDGWTHFSNMSEMPALKITLSASELELKEGETAEITATVREEVDIIETPGEWATSNPEVATVENGKVTAVGAGKAVISYIITITPGYQITESCNVTVTEGAAVDEIFINEAEPVDVFTLQGVAMLRNANLSDVNDLPAGIYIVRQGNINKKVIVR